MSWMKAILHFSSFISSHRYWLLWAGLGNSSWRNHCFQPAGWKRSRVEIKDRQHIQTVSDQRPHQSFPQTIATFKICKFWKSGSKMYKRICEGWRLRSSGIWIENHDPYRSSQEHCQSSRSVHSQRTLMADHGVLSVWRSFEVPTKPEQAVLSSMGAWDRFNSREHLFGWPDKDGDRYYWRNVLLEFSQCGP